jgi:protein-S-isoprenylcysteine O-methyltransferase Ste14
MSIEPPRKTSALPDPQFICVFLIGFTGFLFLSRPTTTTAQLAFRLALMLIGIIGLIAIWIVRKKRASQKPPSDRNGA